MKIRLKLETYWRLGLLNLVRVFVYRQGLNTGLHPVVRLKRRIGGKAFFGLPARPQVSLSVPGNWLDSALYLGWYEVPLAHRAPNWHTNPFTGQEAHGQDQPWWQIPDFGLPVGDIKAVWEASRFDWALTMAQRAANGEEAELARLNAWLSDWCLANPAFLGVNWKCGQEASIRVMHLALAARLLGQDSAPSADLIGLVEAHLTRIQPTVSYAMAQDNNHGTSEAAALFIGGSLCAVAGLPSGKVWQEEGRRWLENRVRRLVSPDGSFSQHSLNYHRLMLETLCLAELWRRWQELPPFSEAFRLRARAAAEWLFQMIEPGSGFGPNLGANDGSNLLPLTGADRGDYRPAVQLAMVLFAGQTAYPGPGHHADHLTWLQVIPPESQVPGPGSCHFPDGGYAVLRKGPWTVHLNYPRYRFRPSHCDALHLDVWCRGENIMGDSGSFSYNTDQRWLDYFPGTGAHNTVAFDDHEQMPLVSRFLRGAWLQSREVDFLSGVDGTTEAQAAYGDSWGCRHFRSVQVDEKKIQVHDQVSGFRRRAVLRWRLTPGRWELAGDILRGEGFLLRLGADVGITRMELVEGWESRYYLQKTGLQVLEVEVAESGTLSTEIMLDPTEPEESL